MKLRAQPILTVKQINVKALQTAADDILRRAGGGMIEELDEYVADWRNRPVFRMYGPRWTGKSRRGQAREVLVAPRPGDKASQIFTWVDQGTKGPYTIKAKNAPYLVFKVPHSPKTLPMPRMVGGTAPRRERIPVAPGEEQWVSVKEVEHPGVEPRHIMAYVATRMRIIFRDEIKDLFKNLPVVPAEEGKWRHVETGRYARAPQ